MTATKAAAWVLVKELNLLPTGDHCSDDGPIKQANIPVFIIFIYDGTARDQTFNRVDGPVE
jgi:hypothetical protein